MKVLQITDPHLYGHASAKLRGVETDSTLRNVLRAGSGTAARYSSGVIAICFFMMRILSNAL